MSIKREAERLLYPDPTFELQDKLGAEFETLEKILKLVEEHGTMNYAVMDGERIAKKLWNDLRDAKDLLKTKNELLDELECSIENKLREDGDIANLEVQYKKLYNSYKRLQQKAEVLKEEWEDAELDMIRRRKMELWFKNYK
jgi:NurA-like 5'-3' nuclease